MTKSSVSALQKRLKASFKGLANKQCLVLFSGGFDSMLLALLAQRHGARVTAVTVRFADFNRVTVEEAMSLARGMKLPHYILHISLQEFLSAFAALPSVIDRPVSDIYLALVHAFFKKYDPQMGGRIFISGMGSDQLFGDKRIWEANIDTNAHLQVAKAHGYRIIFPFLSKEMQAFSQQLPAFAKRGKQLLRKLVPSDYRGPLPERRGKEEIQIPSLVCKLVVRIYGGEKARFDDKTLSQVMERLWLKKSRNRHLSG